VIAGLLLAIVVMAGAPALYRRLESSNRVSASSGGS
jgi:hypothetical protein